MPLFEIKTLSKFENIYLIEADTSEEAVTHVIEDYINRADSSDSSNVLGNYNFYQKHIDESISGVSEICTADSTIEDIEIAEASIRERGYK